MNWDEVRTLELFREKHGRLADQLTGTSLGFHQPDSTRVRWEVERKPFDLQTLVLRPNQRISRAWESIFRIVLDRRASSRSGAYRVVPIARGPSDVDESGRLKADSPDLRIELPDRDRDETKQVVEAVNTATVVANAVSGDAATQNQHQNEELARELGLDRPPIGFS